MKCVVTGATGFIGRTLCAYLKGQQHEVTALSRNAMRAVTQLPQGVECVSWGPDAEPEWKRRVAAADAVFHLAGESIAAKRWTPRVKQVLRASRTEPTRLLVSAMREASTRPGVLISASATGYYGDCGDREVTEATPQGHDFLAQVCGSWEAEAYKAGEFGVRVVVIRFGVVLGSGGALTRILYPFPFHLSPWKAGLAGPLGSGRQWMPWIDGVDAVRLMSWASAHTEAAGGFNGVSPNPVTNREFTQTLGRVVGMWTPFRVPAFALRLALGEFAETLLTGQRAIPAATEAQGFKFHAPLLEPVLCAILAR
ncbi:MAG: TIGR01777 family oxidoreductase [Armatimonadetes bacterium]|nr:TIGR01777 family oxidoreductase [Armatimonadota bacterium]MDE2207720.1 TIGR01777 family oxidoreductase [Armatimonadota bacterium]